MPSEVEMKRGLKIMGFIAGGVILLLAVVVVARALMVEAPEAPEMVLLEVGGEFDKDPVLQRLSEAIQLATITPREDTDNVEPFRELRDKLEGDFPRVHEVAERALVNDLTLHFTIEGSDPEAGHVVFLAHQDVVPVEAGTVDDWTYPPFSGAIVDGFVWGRGTLDNKHNMMAIMEAAEMWFEEGGRPIHTLHFVFGHDEESGGLEGARVVAETMEDEELDVVVVYDEGLVIVDGILPGIDGPIALVGVAERGYLTVEISAVSEGGHASMPPQELAVIRLAEVLQKIDDNPMKSAIDGVTEMMFEYAVAEMDFLNRLVFSNLWLFGPVVLSQMTASPSTNAVVRTTAAPTMLSAGDTENVLPQRASATINYRINPRDSIQGVLDYLEDLIGAEDIVIEATGKMRSEPNPAAPMEGPGFEALSQALGSVYPDVPMAPNMMVGAADARHFTGLTSAVYRFQPVTLTARDLERIHGTNERIEIETYINLIHYYAALLRQW